MVNNSRQILLRSDVKDIYKTITYVEVQKSAASFKRISQTRKRT